MTKQKKVVSVLSTSAISGLVASALMTSQAFAAVDAYTVKVGGDVYQYSKTELMESYLDSTEGTKAPLFEDFQAKLTEAKSVYAYHDDKTGYVTAQSVFDKYLENEKGFNLDQFTESKEAKVVEVPTVKKAVVKDGEIKYEDQNNSGETDDKVKVTSVSAINLKQLKIEFASPVTDSDLKKDVEDVDNYTLDDKDGDEVNSDMIKEVKLDDNKKSATLTFADKVDNKGKYLIENREKYTLTIDEDVTGDEYKKDLVFEDKDLPEVEKVEAVGVDTIKVTFSEPIMPNNIDKISEDKTIAPILDDDDFEINGGDLSISKVELVNNNREANIIVGTDFKDGDKLKVRVKSSVTDYAGLATMSPNKETTVVQDKKVPQVVDFKDVDTEDLKIDSGKTKTYEKVTLIFDKDIKFKNMDNTVIDNEKDLENYYHTSDKEANRAKMVKVDGKELTLYFEDDSFTNGTTNIYIKSGAIESRWEVENEKISTRIEKEVDNTAPEVKKVEQHEDYNNKIKIKFSEKVKCSNDTDDSSARKKKNYTLKDNDGKEWKIDKVEKDGTSEKEFIITTTKDLDDELKYKLTIENIEDKAGNAIKKVTKDFDVKDNDGVAEDDITIKVYSSGTSSQKMVIDFDNKMRMDSSRYSAKDLSKYTLVAKDSKGNLLEVFDGKSSMNVSDMYKADIKSAKNDKAVEITLPSKENKDDLKDKQYNLKDLSVKDKNIKAEDVKLFVQVDRVEDANKNVTERNYTVEILKENFLGKGESGSIVFDDDDDFKPQVQSPEDIFFGFDDKVDFDVKDIKVIAAPAGDEGKKAAQEAADVLAGLKSYTEDELKVKSKADRDKEILDKVTPLSIASHKKSVNTDGNTTVKLTIDKKHADNRYDDDDFNHIFTYDGKYQPTNIENGKIVDKGAPLDVYVFAVPNKTVNDEKVTSTKNDYDETLKIGSKGLVAVEDKLAPSIVNNDILVDTAKQGHFKKGVDEKGNPVDLYNDDEVVEYWQNGTNAAIVLTFEETIDEDTLSKSTFKLDDDFEDAKISKVYVAGDKSNKVVIQLTDVKDGDKEVVIKEGFEVTQKSPFEDLNENEVTGLSLKIGDFKALEAKEIPGFTADDQTKAEEVDKLIANIPAIADLTVADIDTINTAKAGYTALSDIQKIIVKSENVAKLTAATEKLSELQAAKDKEDAAKAKEAALQGLTGKITAAQQAHDAANEDGKVGDYVVGAKATLQAAITKATGVKDNKDATTQQLNDATTELGGAITAFTNAPKVTQLTLTAPTDLKMGTKVNGDITITGYTLAEGETLNVVSETETVLTVDNITKLSVTAIKDGKSVVTVKVKDAKNNIIKVGTVEVTVATA